METTARDIMSTKLVVVHERTSLEEAVKLLVNNKITGLPVVDDDGRMVGIFSEYDVIARVVVDGKLAAESFKKPIAFTSKVTTVVENTALPTILQLFLKEKVRRLPVLDSGGVLVGLISRRDIMRVLYYRAKVGA